MIYLDNAATTWPKPEIVYQTHDNILRNAGNAGRGVNQASLAASRQLLYTRKSLARLFNIEKSERVIFAQNVTEALNTGLQGLLKCGDHVLISSIEHNSVMRPLESLKQHGVEYSVVPCAKDGTLDVNTLRTYLKAETKLLCFTHASNVLGTILPLKQIGQFARENNLLFMVDSAQTAGIIPIDVQEMNIDFLAFTGHKALLGPPGTGGYYLREGLSIKPLIYGGTGIHSAALEQPKVWPEGMESGTRNVPGIAALGAGVEYILNEGINKLRQHELDLTKLLIELLKKIEGVEILGPQMPEKRTGLVACTFSGLSPDNICSQLDRQYGIVTRSGLHCAPFAHKTAGTEKDGALRISLGIFNTTDEIKTLYQALAEILKR